MSFLGQLNFAIRNLTEAEQEKVMDPDALHALDFLRLQYVAPAPLNLVITSTSLEKYDYIFKFLLRLLRMLFVVSHLPRRYADSNARQFRTEAYHFVITLTNYVFQSETVYYFALLLRRRQRKIMALVEEIFDHILLFAKMQEFKYATGWGKCRSSLREA
ncbi:unnamed protein product [Alternaria alternata]